MQPIYDISPFYTDCYEDIEQSVEDFSAFITQYPTAFDYFMGVFVNSASYTGYLVGWLNDLEEYDANEQWLDMAYLYSYIVGVIFFYDYAEVRGDTTTAAVGPDLTQYALAVQSQQPDISRFEQDNKLVRWSEFEKLLFEYYDLVMEDQSTSYLLRETVQTD